MRPRHKAAENVLRVLVGLEAVFVASMRPRHKAAENHARGEVIEELSVGLQ